MRLKKCHVTCTLLQPHCVTILHPQGVLPSFRVCTYMVLLQLQAVPRYGSSSAVLVHSQICCLCAAFLQPMPGMQLMQVLPGMH